MIKAFRKKALERLLKENNVRDIPPELAKRIRIRLEAIDSATVINELKVLSYNLHQLRGDRVGTWSIKVSGNWRITFEFKDGNAYDVDIEDYH